MVPITLKIENFFSHKESIINFDDFALYCDIWLSCTHPDCD